MSNQQSPFVVEQLTPVNPNGQPTATYQLNHASVSPMRIIGRDSLGMPIEDTIPTVTWRWFVMPDGGLNKVPMRTGSVFSMHADAVAYENETIQDLITRGSIPADHCPYSRKFSHWTGGGAFVAIPPGEEDCGGNPKEGGCVHLQQVAKGRRDLVTKRYAEDEAKRANMGDDEIRKFKEAMISGVGEAIAAHVTAPAVNSREARMKNIKEGKSED